jgi:hypothetical protein
MENIFFSYAAGYALLRLALLAGFAYLVYIALRPKHALARHRN